MCTELFLSAQAACSSFIVKVTIGTIFQKKNKMKTIPFLFALAFCVQGIQNYNILGVFPFNGRSHFVMFERLLKGLAAKGHKVDVVSHFPQQRPIPR